MPNPASEFRPPNAQEIEAVTADQLKAIATKMLDSPVSIAAYGDVAFVPSYNEIASMLK